ncbi:carbohydrate ABC transporter permease [Jiangella muralis]|uniref:carbohydrate ABC transporter permease n=1 Tax=Jiangella muralis TaxID=702383 RepID=UPI00069CEE6C|nr:carbohydrate ABC transporter permease [Jiangella muralis]
MTVLHDQARTAGRLTPGPPGERRRRQRTPWRLVNYLLAFAVVALYLLPLLFLLNTALKRPGEFSADPVGLTDGLALGNFVDAWTQGNFGALVANSVLYAVVCAAVGTVLSVLIAFPVARNYVRWSRPLRVLFVLSLFLPNAIVAQFQLVLKLGLYDTRLGYMLLMTAGLGVGPLLVMGYLRSLPRELDEAAAMDGCGYFRFVWTFVFPLCKPVLGAVFILQVIGVWNDIIGATIYLASPELRTISLGLFTFYGEYGNNQWELLAAATLIVAAPLILLYVFTQRLFISGAIAGSLK